MSEELRPCDCGSTDVEYVLFDGDVRYAVYCFRCEKYGPFADTILEAARLWNAEMPSKFDDVATAAWASKMD